MQAEIIDGVLWVPSVITAPGAYGDTMVPVEEGSPEWEEWIGEVDWITAAVWREEDHPRDPGGEGGGQFIEKGSSQTGAAELQRLMEAHATGESINVFWDPNDDGGRGGWRMKPREQWRRFRPDEPHIYADAWPGTLSVWEELHGKEPVVIDISPPNPKIPGLADSIKMWIRGKGRDAFPWWREMRAEYAEQMGMPLPEEASSFSEHGSYVPTDGDIQVATASLMAGLEAAPPDQPALWRGMGRDDSEWTRTVQAAEPGDTLRMLPASWSRDYDNAQTYGDVLLYALPGSKGVSDKARNLSDEEIIAAGDYEVVSREEVTMPHRSISALSGDRTYLVVTVRQRASGYGLTAALWVEADHPRNPAGERDNIRSPTDGGKFAVKSEAVPMGRGGEEERKAAIAVWGDNADEIAAADYHLAQWAKQQQLHMRVPEDAMLEVFNDGEFYNQHQSQSGRGLQRGVVGEAKMFGVEPRPEHLPKYGYVGPDSSQTNMYGPIKINFKPEVLERTTFTMDDSLMQGSGPVIPSPVLTPNYTSMSPGTWDSYQDTRDSGGFDDVIVNEDIPYAEAQVWGRLEPSDIESVEILDESYWGDEDPVTSMPMVDDRAKMEAVISELDRRGIPWSTYEPEGDFSGEWA